MLRSTRSGGDSRAGFTLLELTIAVAIIVTLAAVVTPTLGSALDRARIERTQRTLESLSEGIGRFFKDVGKYPSRLSYLGDKVSGTDLDSCGNSLTSGAANKWNGPYIGRLISAGLPTPIGTADNVLLRNPVTPGPGGSSGTLAVRIPAVLFNDAVYLNALVDGDGSESFGRSNGTVRFPDPASATNTVTLTWITPINGC